MHRDPLGAATRGIPEQRFGGIGRRRELCALLAVLHHIYLRFGLSSGLLAERSAQRVYRLGFSGGMSLRSEDVAHRDDPA